MSDAARYIMIGGFLGAGKTTTVGRLARFLTERGLTVGLITNDQSSGLVDSTILRKQGYDVEEIGGGCFCCRFNTLSDAVDKLSADTRPDVFIAEPVGSCTDLLATVSYPLRRIYGELYRIAPLSVLVDPLRAERVLGLEEGRSFSPKVRYVYEKQLEEADIIVVNKTDMIDDARRARLEEALRQRFPQAKVLACAAREGDGLEAWFEQLLAEECQLRPTMAVDYDEYAEGEALLGWLNATIDVRSSAPFDANALIHTLAESMRSDIADAGHEIAHLKMTLDADQDGQLAVISLVASEGAPDVRESLLDSVDGGSLVVNLRAEADPEVLRGIVDRSLESAFAARPEITWTLEHAEHFRPGRPVPVHREQISSTR